MGTPNTLGFPLARKATGETPAGRCARWCIHEARTQWDHGSREVASLSGRQAAPRQPCPPCRHLDHHGYAAVPCNKRFCSAGRRCVRPRPGRARPNGWTSASSRGLSRISFPLDKKTHFGLFLALCDFLQEFLEPRLKLINGRGSAAVAQSVE